MSRRAKKRSAVGLVLLSLLVLVALDILNVKSGRDEKRVFILEDVAASPYEKPAVAIVRSDDPDLASPARPDAILTYEQVDAIVRKAIDLDTSERRLEKVVEPGDWVVIKPNIVTSRIISGDYYYGGGEHPGQVTDLRVVKSVIHYLIYEERDARRITIAEGGAWYRVGEPGTDPTQKVDGWTVQWPAFDNLSYQQIADEFNGVNGIQVDIVDLNYDTWVDGNGVDNGRGPPIPVPDPNGTGITWYQRPEGYYVSKTLLECDKLINLPVMKTHYIPGVTLIFKNYVGTFMPRAYGKNTNHKGLLHSYAGDKNVPKGFVDLFSYRPTDYAIIEGFWGTEGDGPVSGDNIKLNLVVAGGDPVATDAVAAAVMGFNPRDLGYLYYAAAKGFGTFDLGSIRVVGRQIAEVRHDFIKSMGYKGRGTIGFVGRPNLVWLVNGHYKGGDLETDYLEGEAEVAPKEGDLSGGKVWIKFQGNEERVDLSDPFGAENRTIAYAFTYVYADSDLSTQLWIGADDGAKVWLNGEIVLDKKKAGGII